MDISKVMQLIRSLEPTGWTKFELDEKDFHLKLERGMAESAPAAAPAAPAAPAPAAAPAPEAAIAEPAGQEGAPALSGTKEILSPLVGIFHPLQGDKAVKPGDRLKKGDTVCMVEAMKLMNEIVMPEDGEICFVSVSDGDMVEYNQVLMHYLP